MLTVFLNAFTVIRHNSLGRLSPCCKLPQSFVSVESNNNINDNLVPPTSAFILHGSISFDVQQWQSPATLIVSQAVTKYL